MIEDKTFEKRIELFESIFRRLYFNNPKEAANYYTALIDQNFPGTIKKITEDSHMSYPRLVKGRKELLENGYIAKVINQEDIDFFPKKGELYLPVSPILIWNEHKSEQIRAFNHDEISLRESIVSQLDAAYKKNFGDFGIGEMRNNISVINSYKWLLYTTLNVLRPNTRLSLKVGAYVQFDLKLAEFYDRMLQMTKGLEIKILFDTIAAFQDEKVLVNEDEKRYENLTKLVNNYPEVKFEFGEAAIPHATSRMIVLEDQNHSPYMSIDEWKVLPINKRDPSYMGTIYLGSDVSIWLKNRFQASWEKRKDIL